MASTEKPLISISVIGHVDSGKSTLTGHLATRFGALNKRAQEKLEKIAEENNKSSFSLAYFTDKTETERKRGVTINTTLVPMETPKFRINFLDCPGHADYIKNATNGCKQSDLSIVVVPASFEASCSKDGTLRTHLTLAAILGSKNFIVCINKLDETLREHPTTAGTVFDAACAAVARIFKKLGVKRESLFFLPISAMEGTGLFRDGKRFDFFKGIVPEKKKPGFDRIECLEEAIDYQDAPARPVDKPLRMPIASIAHVPGHGTIYCGRIDYGTIKKGDQIHILPTGLRCEVKNVQAHKTDLEVGEAGMNIGFNVISKDKAAIDMVKSGAIVGPASDADFKIYPFYVASFISLKPSKSSAGEEKGIRKGYTPVMACGTANVATKFVHLISMVGKDGMKVENPPVVLSECRSSVLIYPTKPTLCESVDAYPALAKFVCRDSGILVACGQITKGVTEEEAKTVYGVTNVDGKPEKAKK